MAEERQCSRALDDDVGGGRAERHPVELARAGRDGNRRGAHIRLKQGRNVVGDGLAGEIDFQQQGHAEAGVGNSGQRAAAGEFERSSKPGQARVVVHDLHQAEDTETHERRPGRPHRGRGAGEDEQLGGIDAQLESAGESEHLGATDAEGGRASDLNAEHPRLKCRGLGNEHSHVVELLERDGERAIGRVDLQQGIALRIDALIPQRSKVDGRVHVAPDLDVVARSAIDRQVTLGRGQQAEVGLVHVKFARELRAEGRAGEGEGQRGDDLDFRHAHHIQYRPASDGNRQRIARDHDVDLAIDGEDRREQIAGRAAGHVHEEEELGQARLDLFQVGVEVGFDAERIAKRRRAIDENLSRGVDGDVHISPEGVGGSIRVVEGRAGSDEHLLREIREGQRIARADGLLEVDDLLLQLRRPLREGLGAWRRELRAAQIERGLFGGQVVAQAVLGRVGQGSAKVHPAAEVGDRQTRLRVEDDGEASLDVEGQRAEVRQAQAHGNFAQSLERQHAVQAGEEDGVHRLGHEVVHVDDLVHRVEADDSRREPEFDVAAEQLAFDLHGDTLDADDGELIV